MNIERKIKKTFNLSLLTSIVFVIIGLFLFIKPDTTLSVISYVIGSILIISGISSGYRYFSEKGVLSIFSFDLVYGVLLLISGIFLVVRPDLLSVLFPIILGIWIIINSIIKFQYALVLKKIKNEDFIYTTLISFLTLIWGIVLLYNPFKTALLVTQTIGVFIIVYAVLDIIDNFIIRKNVNEIIKIFK